jgi:hypothetical protein
MAGRVVIPFEEAPETLKPTWIATRENSNLPPGVSRRGPKNLQQQQQQQQQQQHSEITTKN